MSASPEVSSPDKSIKLVSARIFLLLFFGAALWMADCNSDLSFERLFKEKSANEIPRGLKQALGGCSAPEIPVQIASSLSTVSMLLPLPADRTECQLRLQRDYVFICAYTLAYMSLAGVLRHSPGGWISAGKLASLAAICAFGAAGCDIGENYFSSRVLDRLSGDYRIDIPKDKQTVVTPADEQAAREDLIRKRNFSYGKWGTTFVTWMTLSCVFFRRKRFWPRLAAGLLFFGGALGILLGAVKPMFIEWAVTLGAAGIFIGMIIFLGVRSLDELWTQPARAIPSTPTH